MKLALVVKAKSSITLPVEQVWQIFQLFYRNEKVYESSSNSCSDLWFWRRLHETQPKTRPELESG
ncbi:hypothetical protein HanXRQr2_Chr15g0688381 [Helianthus annuus]|uniref:Uncharacterized protein n=1 Tax=Helianthus annuus TaxID=4232 RepID=A0A9K3H1T1_HELAN|nr:hypothetical protein HanXRQr2_Chr15g0688381 [Helianthus annuus]